MLTGIVRFRRDFDRAPLSFARHDGDLPLRDGDVLVAKAEGFTDPDAAVIKEGEEEPIRRWVTRSGSPGPRRR